jgi:hypothetical protein
VSQNQGDGLDEVVGGVVRVTATVAGQVMEHQARERERRLREEQARINAETQRLQGRQGATAAVVVAADVARERVDELHREAVDRGDAAPSIRDGGPVPSQRLVARERSEDRLPPVDTRTPLEKRAAAQWDSPERREALEETLSVKVPDSEAVAARLHVDRSQATPPQAAVAAKPTRSPKARSSRSQNGLERGLGR